MKDALLIELAQTWELQASTGGDGLNMLQPATRETLRQCADILRMLVAAQPAASSPAAQEPQQPAPDVGAMEYRGNTVSFMYDRAKVYGEEIMRVWYVLKEVGHHPGRTGDPLHEVVRRALSAASSPAPAVQPTEAVAELVEALRKTKTCVLATEVRELVNAVLAKHGQPQGGARG